MEVLAHSFGVTVRRAGVAPYTTSPLWLIRTLVGEHRGHGALYIQPRQPDPNP